MGELKPCPFCGGSDIFAEPDETGSGGQWVAPIHVGCKACQCSQSADDMDEAIAAWNRRTHPQPVTPAGGEVVGMVYTMEALVPGAEPQCHVTLRKRLPAGTKLYTHPPVADAALVLDAERYRFWREQSRLAGTKKFYRADVGDTEVTTSDLDGYIDNAMQDAALNQRGGGSNG